MTDDIKTEPCLQGLTPACFREHPDYAKRVFAYRLLQLLLPFEALKRLQKIPGAVWRRPLPDVKGISLTPDLTSGWASIVQPLYLPPWSSGPIKITYGEEGEIIMPVIYKAKINIAAAEDATLVAAVADKKICLTAIALTVFGETNLTLKSGATAISGAMDFGGTNEPRGLTHYLGDYPLKTSPGEALVLTSSIAVQVSGYITYFLE